MALGGGGDRRGYSQEGAPARHGSSRCPGLGPSAPVVSHLSRPVCAPVTAAGAAKTGPRVTKRTEVLWHSNPVHESLRPLGPLAIVCPAPSRGALRLRPGPPSPIPRARRSYFWVHGVNVVTPRGGQAAPPPGWSRRRRGRACPRLSSRGPEACVSPSFPSSSSRSALADRTFRQGPIHTHQGPQPDSSPHRPPARPPPSPGRAPSRRWGPHEPWPLQAPGGRAASGAPAARPRGVGCLRFSGVELVKPHRRESR